MNTVHPASYVLFKVGTQSNFIMGSLVEETDREMIVHLPVVMSFNIGEDEKLELNASKWMPFASEDIVQIPKQQLSAISFPKQSIIDFYIQFLKSTPELIGDSLENEVLAQSTPKSSSEFVTSSVFH